MKRANQILSVSQVYARFSANRCVYLREKRGRNLNHGNTAHEDGGEETSHVIRNAAAERKDDARSVRTGLYHLPGQRFHMLEAFGRLTARKEQRFVVAPSQSCSDRIAKKRPYVGGGGDKESYRPEQARIARCERALPAPPRRDNSPGRSALHMSAHFHSGKELIQVCEEDAVYHVDIDRVHTIDCDYLVVGAGVAGLRAAIELCRSRFGAGGRQR